jgi:hypothetical protein
MNIKIEITKPLTLHPERMRVAMADAVLNGTILLETAVRDRAPVGLGGQSGLQGSIAGDVKELAQRIEGLVGTPLKYALPVEYGRRANQTPPPVSALIPWVERFITLDRGETAKGVAFAIARYIGLRGTRSLRQSPPGERMFLRGFYAAEPLIQRVLDRAFHGAVKTVME